MTRGRQARCLLESGPGRREYAADRHVGEEAEHDEGEERAQIAGAGPGEVAAGAAAGEHHAEAEDQAADDVADPVETRAGEVHGFVQRHDAAACSSWAPPAPWRRGRHAAATALVGAQLLQAAGVVDLGKSMYLAGGSLNWAGHILGGLMFGFGMVFTGGCPSRNLARAGSGDLRSLLTLVVLGLFAYMAIGGLFGPARVALEQATSIALRDFDAKRRQHFVESRWPHPENRQPRPHGAARRRALLYCFGDGKFRASPCANRLRPCGWPHHRRRLGADGLAFDDMATKPVPPISLTYVRPTGDALQWLTLFTAEPVPGFGTASVFGALLGAFLAALAMGRFRITTFSDAGDTLRNLFGAVLMGVGGVMALGCTIGQSITGVSTLALGSFLTFAAIVAGGFWGLRVLERRILAGA